MDAAFKQRLIRHVVDQVGFDIEYAAQRFHCSQGFGRDRRLTDNVTHRSQGFTRKGFIGLPGNCRWLALQHIIPGMKLTARRVSENQIQTARIGGAEHQRFANCRH